MTTVSHWRRHVIPTNGVRAFFQTPLGRALRAIAEGAAVVGFVVTVVTAVLFAEAMGWL